MISAKTTVPVKNENGSYVVPTKPTGEHQLEASVTDSLYEINCTMKAVLSELKLLNARVEVAFETTTTKNDIEE